MMPGKTKTEALEINNVKSVYSYSTIPCKKKQKKKQAKQKQLPPVYLANRKRKKFNTRRIKAAPSLNNFQFMSPSHVL